MVNLCFFNYNNHIFWGVLFLLEPWFIFVRVFKHTREMKIVITYFFLAHERSIYIIIHKKKISHRMYGCNLKRGYTQLATVGTIIS